MHDLHATGDIRKVSLLLGHATLQSTEFYLRADPTEKLAVNSGRPDKLLAMLRH
jgi:site-specific recombinase XerC